MQWLKWSCEAGGAHPTKPGWSKPHTHSPPNLALFAHNLTLYRFKQGAHTIAGQGAQIGAVAAEPRGPLTLTSGLMCNANVVNRISCFALYFFS